MSRLALIAAVFLGLGLAVVAGNVRSEEAPTVSRALAKPLKAANDALAAKNFAEVIAKTKEAGAMSPKTAYDEFVINYLQVGAYSGMGNTAEMGPAMERTIDSPYLPAAAKVPYLKALMTLAYQNKNYDKAVQYGERVKAAGDTNADVALTVAQANYLLGKYKEALTEMDAIESRDEAAGHKPSEKGLNIIWSCAIKLKDDAAASKAIEKLILNYPKPDYWSNAMVPILQNHSNDDRLNLMTYRLMYEVGILKRGADYRDMAQIALDQGNPGEAQTVIEQALAKNLFTEQREKESNQRLLDAARKKGVQDKATLERDTKDAMAAASGDPLVQLGGAYLGYGQPDKAVTNINAGIAKGKLKNPDEAYMLLGIAQERSKNGAEAVRAFNKATADPKYARLAKLWVLQARG